MNKSTGLPEYWFFFLEILCGLILCGCHFLTISHHPQRMNVSSVSHNPYLFFTHMGFLCSQ